MEVKIDKDDRQESEFKNRINKDRGRTAMLNTVQWHRHITRKKIQIYNSIVKINKFNKKLESILMSMEMDFRGDRRDVQY